MSILQISHLYITTVLSILLDVNKELNDYDIIYVCNKFIDDTCI